MKHALITLDLAARVSTGREMPDGSSGVRGGVVLASAEDGMGDTVRPRLEVAGADLTRIVDMTAPDPRGGLLRIPNSLAQLEQAVLRVGAVLVVIDPIFAFLRERVDTHKDSDVRLVLTPLAKLAERLHVAVILVRHLNKSEQQRAVYRGGGSIAVIGLARSGLLVAKSSNSGQLVLASTKCNLALQPKSLYYCLESAGEVPRIKWEGEATETADQLIAPAMTLGRRPQELQQAASFIASQLSAGPMPSATLDSRASEVGISAKTYQRARELVGVESRQARDGWISSLPDPPLVLQPDSQIVRRPDGGADSVVTGLA